MPSMSQFIIITKDAEIHYHHGDFSTMALPVKITGLYAYIAYKTEEDQIFVACPFKDYKSMHSGIALVFNSAKNKHLSFFILAAQERIKKFMHQGPSYGGEVLFEDGNVLFWNFKSKAYSARNFDYNDFNPELNKVIASSIFPANSFMKIKDADVFAERYLNKNFFEQDGQYGTPQQIENKEKIKDFLATIFLTTDDIANEAKSELTLANQSSDDIANEAKSELTLANQSS
ncbi:MAG: hypothetical protein QM652_07105, partial [Legionella sp.]|uniref:hypothetical protein n=1 Tax=Legionella sp. TaxID=459 RepID=UPI0039E37256